MHVLTCGTFDLFHPGHLFLLRECRKLTTLTSITSTDGSNAGGVIVGLNPDDFAATYGKPAPVMSYEERRTMLEGCRFVDRVVENVHGNTMALLEEHRPGFLVIGQDWATRDYYTQIGVTQQELDAMGVSLLYIPRPADTISSTEIKGRVLSSPDPDPDPRAAAWYAAHPEELGVEPDHPRGWWDPHGQAEQRMDEMIRDEDGKFARVTARPSRENVSTAPRTAP